MTLNLVLATGVAYAAVVVVIIFCIWRVAAPHRKLTPRGQAREAVREPSDKNVVYLTRDSDRAWWTDKFGVSTDVLRAAMRQVGPMSKDIERHLAIQGRDREALPA